MLPIPDEIKDKLAKALDDENDVDDATVVEMVSVLEKYPITRATLEETKIGKMVNDLRRKIKNEKLAKRVKQLVRNWKKILEETTPTVNNGSVLGPSHPTLGQLRSSPAVSPALSRVVSTTRLVSPGKGSPAQGKMSPSQGRLCAKNASPALVASRSVNQAASYKAVSPGLGSGMSSQKMASPGLPGGGQAKVVSSAALMARNSSVTVSGRVVSPVVSGRMVSPLVSRKGTSPAGVERGTRRDSPLLTASPSLESKSTLKREHGLSADKGRPKKGISIGEMSKTGDKSAVLTTPHSGADRLGGDGDKDMQESTDELPTGSSKSASSDNTHPYNHSTKPTVSFNSHNKNYKDQRELSKTNMANRKRARETLDSPVESKKARTEMSSLSANSHQHGINGYTPKSKKQTEESASIPLLTHQESVDSNTSSHSLDRRGDKHKVKTTEQLIQELQRKNNGSSVGHTIVTKLRNNQIEREQDMPASSLPAGMKPRGKRGRPKKNETIQPPPTNINLSQVKSELVERFLNTSHPASPPPLDDPFRDKVLSNPGQISDKSLKTGCSQDVASCSSTSRQDLLLPAVEDEEEDPAKTLPTSQDEVRSGSALTLEEIYAQLPPVDDNIDWDAVDFFELPEPAPVTEESVERLHTERLPGVNGLYDINGDWTSWHQLVTLPGYLDTQLHILPYVDLDN